MRGSEPAGWTPPGDGREVDPSTPGYRMLIARAAVLLGILPPKLADWRRRGIGPSWRREGGQRNGTIYYAETEIRAIRKSLDEARASEPRAAVKRRIEATTKKPARARRGKATR